MSMDDGPSAAREVAAHHGTRGTTSVIASLVSASPERMLDAVGALASVALDAPQAANAADGIVGIHLEGPFLSPARRGAHDLRHLRAPRVGEVESLLERGRGTVKMMTLAPELPGALDVIDLLVRHDVVAAIGHTDADAAQCRAAVDRGASVATHLFNGMPPMLNRAGGPVAQLAGDSRVRCEVIHDGSHVDDNVLRVLHHALLPNRLLLVSDASSPTGCADGDYALGDEHVVLRDGVVRTQDGRSLAGSARPLLEMLAHAIALGLPVVDAVAAASWLPADTLGLTGRGRLEAGASADVLIVDAEWRPRRVMARGTWLT
jgi:N-acetylglucosamine-6-phosphate deacetylase